MAQRDNEAGQFELSRRDFLKVSAVGAAAAGAMNFAPAPAMAAVALHGSDTAVTEHHTTCPYCSASCGQIVLVGNNTGDVYDIFGDPLSPINKGGLCSKGAGGFQYATNVNRLGAFAGTHPVDPAFEYDPAFLSTGVAYKRIGNGAWSKVALPVAMADIATKLVAARGAVTAANGYNSKGVAFFGSSHMNQEQNYTYRKLIAEFGTSNVEHQARI